MEELGKLLCAQNIPFHSEDRRIMCFPHIINICCQHVISDFTHIELSESAEDFFADLLPDCPHLQTFEEAVKRDPVALGHNIVHALRASGQRRDTFDETICDGNSKGWFEVKQLKDEMGLCLLYAQTSARAASGALFQSNPLLLKSQAYWDRP